MAHNFFLQKLLKNTKNLPAFSDKMVHYNECHAQCHVSTWAHMRANPKSHKVVGIYRGHLQFHIVYQNHSNTLCIMTIYKHTMSVDRSISKEISYLKPRGVERHCLHINLWIHVGMTCGHPHNTIFGKCVAYNHIKHKHSHSFSSEEAYLITL